MRLPCTASEVSGVKGNDRFLRSFGKLRDNSLGGND